MFRSETTSTKSNLNGALNEAKQTLKINISLNSLEHITNLRLASPNNPLISYLNINSLRNKITDLREILKTVSPDYFVIAETKLNHEFPNAQFLIDNYEIKNRIDRDKYGGGLIEYVKKGVVCRPMKQLEPQNSEILCSELTVRKTKWIIVSVYRPPTSSNLKIFFEELEKTVEEATAEYDNVIVMGDINIDKNNANDYGYGSLTSFCEMYNLKNLIKGKTCFTRTHESSIDVILTNKSKSFQHTQTFETGLSDHHHMIATFLKTHLVRLKPKYITYRNYKRFDEGQFITDVQNTNFNCDNDDQDLNYENLVNSLLAIIDKHAPLKQKVVRGNQAPFMTRELRKAIYTRSRFKNKLNKNPTDENRTKYKKQRNKCVSLRKKAIKNYFRKVTDNGIMDNKNVWDMVKPFVTNKSGLTSHDIMIIHNDSLITDEKELTELFNEQYINIVEKSSGIKPSCLSNIKEKNNEEIISSILKKYENHPSVAKIKKNKNENSNFRFHEIDEDEIKNLFHKINIKKSTGEDQIPPKLVKLASKHLLKPVTNAVNSSIRSSVFPKKAKRAAVTPLDKGGKDKNTIGNFRPVSVLNVFSKFFENVIKNQITVFLDTQLSIFISAYRKSYSTQHVLMRLTEEWRNKLDKNYVVGTVLMDLSKAFDCVPHDLLIAKLDAYGFDKDALSYILSYLTEREQATRINNIYSLYQLILSGVPQGSILGPILFNLFINDLIYFIKIANVHNYADDNTLTAFSNSIPNLVKILEDESDIAISWLNKNNMIANPDKFLKT